MDIRFVKNKLITQASRCEATKLGILKSRLSYKNTYNSLKIPQDYLQMKEDFTT